MQPGDDLWVSFIPTMCHGAVSEDGENMVPEADQQEPRIPRQDTQ